ncbi:ankyrin repeat-containing domain protein, partial [Phaeosphaeriaceae sp. PMI808]
ASLMSNASQHRKKHTKPYPCETCGESFGLRTDMRRHVQARHRLGQKMHPCSIDGCGFKATRKDNIRQHLRKSHKNIPLAPAKPPGKRRRITRAQAPLSEEAKPFDVSSTLMQAASMGNVPLAEMMMKHGAQLSIQAADGSTALHCAVKANKTHMTQFLLEAGAPLETRNGKNATPLHEAIEESNQDAFNMLLERGAVVSEVELEKVIKKGDLTLFRAMIVHLGEHWINKWGQVMLAVAEGKVEIMEILLNHPDIEVNNLDRWGFTALHIAAANGRIELVKTLLQHTKIMADAHGNNHRGIEPTPLHISAQRGHVEVVKVLMGRFDVMVNRTNRQGRTPLLIAIRSGKSDVVDYMLRSAEIDVTIQDHKRKTMLTVAIERGHIDMVVRFLLEYNNELGIWKSDDMVLVSNKDSTDEEIWDMLLNAHIPLFNGTDRKIELLLHAVAKHGNIPMLSCLLQSDQIDINLRSRTGWTALHLSARKGHTECVELLLQDRRVNV